MTEKFLPPNRRISRIIVGTLGAASLALLAGCSSGHQQVGGDMPGEGSPSIASDQPPSAKETVALSRRLEKAGATTPQEKLRAVVKFACKTYGDDTSVLRQFDKDDYTGVVGLTGEDPKVAAVSGVYSLSANDGTPLLEAMQRECDSSRLDRIVTARHRTDKAEAKEKAAFQKEYGSLRMGNTYKQTEALDQATQYCQVVDGDYSAYLDSGKLPTDKQVNNFIKKLKKSYETTEQHPSDTDRTARLMPRDADGLQCPGSQGDYGEWRSKWFPNRG